MDISKEINKAYKNRHPSDCRVLIKPNRYGNNVSEIDVFLESNGLNSAKGQWVSINLNQAKAILIDLISNSICYGSTVINESTAKKYANRFCGGLGNQDTKFYTNLVAEKYSTPFSLKSLRSYDYADILPDYLVSIAVVGLNHDKIGVFVRGEWD